MWSGQCRVEAVPAHGSGLQLEGLRLRLDLHLSPNREATAAPARAPLLHTRWKRWLLAGLGGLLVVLVGWGWHAGSPRSGAPAALQSAPEPARPRARPDPPPAAAAPSLPLPAPATPGPGRLPEAPEPARAASSAPTPRLRPRAAKAPLEPRTAGADRLELFGDTK